MNTKATSTFRFSFANVPDSGVSYTNSSDEVIGLRIILNRFDSPATERSDFISLDDGSALPGAFLTIDSRLFRAFASGVELVRRLPETG